MRRTAIALLVVAVAGMRVAAQAPAAAPTPSSSAIASAPAARSLPSAGDLFARYRMAMGGESLVRKYTSRRTAGRFELPAQGIGGAFETLAAAPDRMRIRIDLAALGSMQRGYDGTAGWAVDPAVGPRLVDGAELDEMRTMADFYYDLHPPGTFVSATVVERTAFEGRDCYAVKLVRASGFEVLEYYDAQTSLLAGFRMNSTSSMGTVPSVVTVLEDYKPFGGVLTPTRARQRAMGIESVMTITSIDYEPIPAAAFTPPAEIQALRK